MVTEGQGGKQQAARDAAAKLREDACVILHST